MRTDTDASIKDALYAIRGMQKSKLYIKKTLFAKNFIGIRSTDGLFSLNQFEENKFDGQGPLKRICSLAALNDVKVVDLQINVFVQVPYFSNQGFAGLYFKDAGLVNMPDLPFGDQNLFYGLANGIVAMDTDLALSRNSRFSDITWVPFFYDLTLGGVAVRYLDTEMKGFNGIRFRGNGKSALTADIDDCSVGFFVVSKVPATAVSGTGTEVTQCRMTKMHLGVFLSDNYGNSGTFKGSRGNFYRGIGNNYIEVAPTSGGCTAILLSCRG